MILTLQWPCLVWVRRREEHVMYIRSVAITVSLRVGSVAFRLMGEVFGL